MTGRHYRFWMGLTLVLSSVFVALFFPMIHGRRPLAESLAYTGIGVLVIWGVYFARAAIFSHILSHKKPPPGDHDIA
jgi:hypothetical protein